MCTISSLVHSPLWKTLLAALCDGRFRRLSAYLTQVAQRHVLKEIKQMAAE